MTTATAATKPISVDVREQPRTVAEQEFIETVSAAVDALNGTLEERMSITARIDPMCRCCGCGAHLGAFVSFTARARESLRARLAPNSAENILPRLGAVEFCRVHLRADRRSADAVLSNPGLRLTFGGLTTAIL